jgi:hypothetical protein
MSEIFEQQNINEIIDEILTDLRSKEPEERIRREEQFVKYLLSTEEQPFAYAYFRLSILADKYKDDKTSSQIQDFLGIQDLGMTLKQSIDFLLKEMMEEEEKPLDIPKIMLAINELRENDEILLCDKLEEFFFSNTFEEEKEE